MAFGTAISGLLTGLSGMSGALNNRSRTTTTTPTYSGPQYEMQSTAANTLQDRLRNPVNLNPLKTAAIGKINQTYDGASDRLTDTLTSRGFGRSGKVGTNQAKLETERAGAIGSNESKFAGMQIDQNNQTLQQALQFAFAGPGQKTTQPGNPLGGAISGASETATLLYALNHMLSGGGSVGDVPGGNSSYTGGEGLLQSVMGH